MQFDTTTVTAALRRLRQRDPIMRELIQVVGPFTLKLEQHRFRMLVRSIIAQQISGSAARAIRRRLERAAAPRRITPSSLADLSLSQMRSAGVSPQKSVYLSDLASKVVSGQVRLNHLWRMSDLEVIDELTQVKGVGVWTAKMFLMFSLGRLDVLPHDDLGIRTATRNLYGLAELPDVRVLERIAANWRPYATIASWYCWRSHDLARIDSAKGTDFPG